MITWLHLSDLHACPRHGWDADRITETLVADLRRLQADHGLRPDLIFFTGDAAFGHLGEKPGKTISSQFEHFAMFLEAVRTAFKPEIPKIDVFLVPGNHDIHRDFATPEQTEWLDRQKSIDPVRSMIQAGGVQWRRYMERLADYRDFLEGHGWTHLLGDPDRLIYSTVREVGGVRVGIAGFNTAWSCCRVGERGHLWMAGQWQQGMLRPELKGTDFSIALMHHPPDWLVEYENLGFGRGLQQDFKFLLHGHEHRDWVLTAEGYTVLSAGACYESSETENNGYNLVRLDVKESRGEVWLRRFEAMGGGWVARPISGKAEQGVWTLRHLDWLAECGQDDPEPLPEPSLDGLSDPEPPVGEETAEQDRYLQRLRAAHRDLPLAGFETRVRLPICISDVYIPLRARPLHVAMDRELRPFGAHRELDERETELDISFDQALDLAGHHGLRGAVVLGDPGSGKTTLLKHFVLAVTDPLIGPKALGLPKGTLPVLIELRRLSDPASGLVRALEEAVARADIALEAPKFTGQLLKRDHLLLLVDGLDEVADRDQRASVSRWLEEAIRQLPKSTFVITSRYAGYKREARLNGQFLELHVRDVEAAPAKRFIDAWYQAVESQAELGRDAETAAALAREAAADLQTKIFQPEDLRTQSLRALAKNPLMLQILCLVHRDRKQLPERRVELYRECVQVLLELWRRAKDMLLSFDAQQALRLLQPLAYRLHVDKRREADLEELLPHLEQPLLELRRGLGDGVKLLQAIRDQSGVLVSLGQGAYGFLHLSFQEYLTALYVQDHFAREPEVLQELAGKFGDPWWREVILLALGLNNPSLFEPLMEAVIKQSVLHRDVALADDCLRDALATSPRPFVQALAGGIKETGERYHLLRLLRAISGWESVQVGEASGRELVEALAHQDEDREVRGMAVELLGGSLVTDGQGVAVLVPGQNERIHEKDGSVLVYVPGGEFTLGTDEDLEYFNEEYCQWPKPKHRVRLSPFWIGKYPVTNAQYQRFLEAMPDQEAPGYWDDKQLNEPEQPVVGVSWLDAVAYCRWAGFYLPTEAQWEASARGTDVRCYPWGNDKPTSELANYSGAEGRPSPVGAYLKGAGPYGTLDQAGNVWEWCRDEFDKDAYRDRAGREDPLIPGGDADDESAVRVLRGGSWADEARGLPAAIRGRYRAGLRHEFFGFRVVCQSGPEP